MAANWSSMWQSVFPMFLRMQCSFSAPKFLPLNGTISSHSERRPWVWKKWGKDWEIGMQVLLASFRGSIHWQKAMANHQLTAAVWTMRTQLDGKEELDEWMILYSWLLWSFFHLKFNPSSPTHHCGRLECKCYLHLFVAAFTDRRQWPTISWLQPCGLCARSWMEKRSWTNGYIYILCIWYIQRHVSGSEPRNRENACVQHWFRWPSF